MAKEAFHAEARAGNVYRILDGLDLRGLRVLDAGCGFGRDVAEFRRRGAEAYGCDASVPLLEEARRVHGDYFARWEAPGGEIPFEGSFDLIWTCMLLVHVPREAMPELVGMFWQKLRPGGRLVINTKTGAGEKVMGNLGEGLERVMVYYAHDEIISVIKNLGGEIEFINEDAGRLVTGDGVLEIRARKGA